MVAETAFFFARLACVVIAPWFVVELCSGYFALCEVVSERIMYHTMIAPRLAITLVRLCTAMIISNRADESRKI